MRMAILGVCVLASFVSVARAQQGPSPGKSPSDVAPPPEIVVPAQPEELPPPAASGPAPVVSPTKVLRPGMFVTGEVELYPRVRVEDRNEIHPRAVPMVIAVMDPHEGPWHPHANRRWRRGRRAAVVSTPIVFVTVMVPPFPPRSVQVQHEEIELNYGDYQVNIDCEEGVVEIEYDD